MSCICGNIHQHENMICNGPNCNNNLCNKCNYIACEHCSKVFCGDLDNGCAKIDYDITNNLLYKYIHNDTKEIVCCFDCWQTIYSLCNYCGAIVGNDELNYCNACSVDLCSINCYNIENKCESCNNNYCDHCHSDLVKNCSRCSITICDIEYLPFSPEDNKKCSFDIFNKSFCENCYNTIINSCIKIQKTWRKARYSPKYKLCENTLINNLKNLGVTNI